MYTLHAYKKVWKNGPLWHWNKYRETTNYNCGHSTSEVWICIEKSKLATYSKSHKSELITNLRFLVKPIKYYDRHFEYGTRFLGFTWLNRWSLSLPHFIFSNVIQYLRYLSEIHLQYKTSTLWDPLKTLWQK